MLRITRMAIGVPYIDLVGINLPPGERVESISNPRDAVRAALVGYLVDYDLMPDPRARFKRLLREASVGTNRRLVMSDGCAEARTLLSIVQCSTYIQLTSKPTPLLEAVLQSMLLDTEACKHVGELMIVAPGWANFMQQVYDVPSLFPALYQVSINGIPLLDGDPHMFIPVRARVLQLHCAAIGTTAIDKWADSIIETINRAECDVLSATNCSNIDTARIVNTRIQYVSIRTDAFVADLPNLKEIDILTSGLRVFDGGRYPKLRRIWVSHMTLDELINILCTTPSLTRLSSTSDGDKIPYDERLDAIREHAPHLFECAKYPYSYRWTPRVHESFGSTRKELIAAYVIGAQRVSDAEGCAAFDPAAFEETIRHLRINDR